MFFFPLFALSIELRVGKPTTEKGPIETLLPKREFWLTYVSV
jgi:hypothetical protein